MVKSRSGETRPEEEVPHRAANQRQFESSVHEPLPEVEHHWINLEIN